MSVSVAGHEFEIDGICRKAVAGGPPICGRRWSDIRNVTEDEIGQGGIAHTLHLNTGEYLEIKARREAEDKALEQAMRGIGP